MKLCSLKEIVFSAIEIRTLAFRYRRYGRPTLVTAGLLVLPSYFHTKRCVFSTRYRVIQPECLISFFVLVLQSCFGVFIQSLMTGLIFSKLARPKQRAHTIMFSRLAVVCKRDCEYQLLFRVGNMRRSHIIATSIRALLVKDR